MPHPLPRRRPPRSHWRRGWRRKAAQRCPACNLGGGFGIPYFPGDVPLDLAAVGQALADQMVALPAVLAETAFCVELGRYLVGEAGVYLTRIVDRKVSHGEVFSSPTAGCITSLRPAAILAP